MIFLRPIDRTDSETLAAHLLHEEACPAVGLPRPATPATAEEWIERIIGEMERGEAFTFGIVADGGHLAGTARIGRIHPERRSAQLSYWTALPFRRRNIATAGGELAVRFAFATLRLQRIAAFVAVGNGASRGVMRRLKFRDAGIIRSPHDEREFLIRYLLDNPADRPGIINAQSVREGAKSQRGLWR